MKKKKERGPDLIEYKFKCSFNGGLSVDKFFMAYSPENALAQLAYSFIKQLPFKNLSDEEKDCFTQAFSDPHKPFMEKPDLTPLPEPIPDIDFPEPEPEPTEIKTEKPKSEKEEEAIDSPSLDETVNTPLEHNSKPDPVAEHLAKQQKRLAQIAEIERENQLLSEKYETLNNHIHQMTEWFNKHLEILVFEEYNRWSYKWNPITFPLSKKQEEGLGEMENENGEANQDT